MMVKTDMDEEIKLDVNEQGKMFKHVFQMISTPRCKYKNTLHYH